MTPQEAAAALIELTPRACQAINGFSQSVLRTRGGRLGSGMGTLLEALWGYYVNEQLRQAPGGQIPCEIAWLSDHEYNDFALLGLNAAWEPATKSGELLRIEAKSMNSQVDESKGHFDELVANLAQNDLLLVLVWSWEAVDDLRVYPFIRDFFIGAARPIAELRDRLHLARGGAFVRPGHCPDACPADNCRHIGEPLNASGKRERLSGPINARPAGVSYAANFGGLVRMLKTSSPAARAEFRLARQESPAAHQYISFIHRNFPAEERNQFLRTEWASLALSLGIAAGALNAEGLQSRIRDTDPTYQDKLRALR